MSIETKLLEKAGRGRDSTGSLLQHELVVFPVASVLLIAIWELMSTLKTINPIILPAPSSVGRALVDLVTAPWFPQHVLATAYSMFAGFVLGSALGLVLGILLANVPLFRKASYPWIVAFQAMPKVVLAPIFLTWFGLGFSSKIAMAAAIAFFPVLVNTILGLDSVEENAELLMRSLVASKWQTFTKLAFPNALPAIFAGLETSATLSLIGAIVAEFVSARAGLGLLISTFNFEMKMGLVFAAIVVVSLVGLALYASVVYAQAKIVFWRRAWKKETL